LTWLSPKPGDHCIYDSYGSVKCPPIQHDIVFQTSDTTWHAYNGWGGYSLYGGGTAESDGRAYKVSYNRPIATRDGVGTYAGPQDFLFGEEIAAIHSLALYKNPSGSIVFGAGTVMWSWGLDPNHDPDPHDTTQTPVDPKVKQAMVNLLADMGALPGSLQSGLVAATKSGDTIAPTCIISSPVSGASFPQNQNVCH
jgi:hypothetical protein